MQYRGDVQILEHDPRPNARCTPSTRAKHEDKGTATARVDLKLTDDQAQTHVDITAHVQLSGNATAMGAGAIRDEPGWVRRRL